MFFNVFNFYFLVYVYLVSYNMFFLGHSPVLIFKIKKSNIHTLANDGKMTYYLKPEPERLGCLKFFSPCFYVFCLFYFLAYIYLVDYSIFFSRVQSY